MQKEKGSITIFSLLSLLLITAFLFGLLEGTRLQEMRRFAILQTENSLVSVFANYNTCLWKMYHLLGTNQNDMYATLEKATDGRNGKGTNFLCMAPTEILITGETRITDGEGLVFISSVADYMKDNLVYETVKEVYSQYEAIKDILEKNQMDLSNITDALIMQESVKKTRTRSQDMWVLLEAAERWRKMGVLQLVIQDTETLSKQHHDFSNGLCKRNILSGRNSVDYTPSWTDRILLQQYLMTYLSSYTQESNNRALIYELEYLIGRKSSDIENLKISASKILAIREAANFLYLMSSPEHVGQAEAMALLLVGAVANPIFVEVVKLGLLTSWAMAESILDVRALLKGKRIPLLKGKMNWTTELKNISAISESFSMAKESAVGLNYKDYLGLLLLFEEEKELAMYSMNLQEATIRQNNTDVCFGLDMLLTEVSVAITYTYEPVFPFLRVIDAEERWERRIDTNAKYGYYGKAGTKG